MDREFSIENISGEILFSRKVTRAHRYHLRSALLTQSLNEGEHILIDRVFYGIRKGLLRVED